MIINFKHKGLEQLFLKGKSAKINSKHITKLKLIIAKLHTSVDIRDTKMHMHSPPHPGEILKELYLEPLELTISEVAKGIGISRKSFSELINGKFGISPDMAIRLAKAFSTTPESWLNLQQQYDLWKEEKKHTRPRIKVFVRHQHQSAVV